MAVLFTDIVGSSDFFKKHGNISGRTMLRLHQDMVSPLIAEFGGAVVKLLGDSVMAYFLNPGDAIKSAVKIQQRFKRYNKEKEEKDQIHIRLCIHYGEGIVEDKDIFGDVVNIAAKFLPFAGSDQIFISEEVHAHVKDLSSLNFLKVDIPSENAVLNGLIIYNVIWNELADFDPILRTLLYMKPAWSLGERHFSDIWEDMLLNRDAIWQKDRIIKEDILPDRSVCLILKESHYSMVIAKKIINFLKTNPGHIALTLLPLQIIIDSGPFLRAGRLYLEDLSVNWETIEPGEIYASVRVLEFIKKDDKNLSTVKEVEQGHPYIKVIMDTREKNEQYLFLYQNALVQGDNPPCFYCGARTHLARSCPSKAITGLTRFIDKIGYLSIHEINNLYFNYIYEQDNNNIKFDSGKWNASEISPQWAHYCFYELNSVFQLRFFRTLWNHRDENWNDIKKNDDTTDKGGLLWLALDCLRVSNFSQAESIISESLSKQSGDYKTFCTAAFLNIEKDNLKQANAFLKKASELAKTAPQKILILFLRSRIYHLTREPIKAEEMIRGIIRLSPYCHEALYQDLLHRFKYGNKAMALQHLLKLIKLNRDYYVIALVDPELSDFSKDIQPKLEQLLLETREKANLILPEADNELNNLKDIIGNDSKEFSEIKALLLKVKDLSSKDSYFAYLDIIHYGGSISHMSSRIIAGRETGLSTIYDILKQRLTCCTGRVRTLPYPFLARSASIQLSVIRERFYKTSDSHDLHDPEKFKKSIKSYDMVSDELSWIESKLNRLEGIGLLLKLAARFMKKNILFQSVNLIIALILFPIIAYYLEFILPDLNISSQGIWGYQKIVFILGGITALILATVTSREDARK